MSQSSIIAATLLAGFVLFLAANDRLKVYAAVLWGDTKATLPSSEVKTPSGGGIPGPGGIPGVGGAGGFGDLLGGAGSLLESAGPELLLLGGL